MRAYQDLFMMMTFLHALEDKMRKIRICHVIGDFVNGGAEAVLYNYFSHMELERFEVHIIGHGVKVQACADRFAALGFTIHNIPPKRVSFIKSCRAMDAIFKAYQFDIVHSHLTEWACVPLLLAWKDGVKVRINHSHMAENPTGLRKLYYGVRIGLGRLAATDDFACGYAAGQYLFGKRRMAQGRVTVLPNAIEVKRFRYDEAARCRLRAALGIAPDTVVLGHVGRFFTQKNHPFLIDIFAAYQQRNPNSRLLLLGDGENRAMIQARVQEMGLSDQVFFAGNRDNIAEWYQAMDVFLLPSFFEGFPVSGVEAQAAGVPCLFADTVTSEVRLSPYVQFLPLSASADAWADAICKALDGHDRAAVSLPDRYDIVQTAAGLQRFYLEKAGSKRC